MIEERKYKEGDVIIFNKEFYLCEISGKYTAMFQKIVVNDNGFCSSCSEPLYLNSTIKNTQKSTKNRINKPKWVKNNHVEEKFPVVGYLPEKSLSFWWNLKLMLRHYPKMIGRLVTDKKVVEKIKSNKEMKKLLKNK